MTQIELIRAEIQRRKKDLRAGICNEEVFTTKQRREMLVASEELDRLKRFLDRLEQEQEPEHFNDALIAYYGRIPEDNDAYNAARYFSLWGIHAGSQKADALQVEPQKLQWRKYGNGACGSGDELPIAIVRYGSGLYRLASCLTCGDEFIYLNDLEKLPKEGK